MMWWIKILLGISIGTVLVVVSILHRGSNELGVQMNGGIVVVSLVGGLVVYVGKLNGGLVVVGFCVNVVVVVAGGTYLVVVSGANVPIDPIEEIKRRIKLSVQLNLLLNA